LDQLQDAHINRIKVCGHEFPPKLSFFVIVLHLL
jgi:hypothetical protein